MSCVFEIKINDDSHCNYLVKRLQLSDEPNVYLRSMFVMLKKKKSIK